MTDWLLDGLPKDQIVEAFKQSPGNEIEGGKISSPESSAALAANTFGLFLNQPDRLPPILGIANFGWPAIRVTIEECMPFPWWPRGRHPWLDALIETETHIIGVESKRYEPFRSRKAAKFSETYWRSVWGDSMQPFESMRDQLSSGEQKFERLDAPQLVKHAFGLRTEGRRRGKSAVLVYLYAEPDAWPDQRPVCAKDRETHSLEASKFSACVAGAEVKFRMSNYKDLLAEFCESGDPMVVMHAERLAQKFDP